MIQPPTRPITDTERESAIRGRVPATALSRENLVETLRSAPPDDDSEELLGEAADALSARTGALEIEELCDAWQAVSDALDHGCESLIIEWLEDELARLVKRAWNAQIQQTDGHNSPPC